MSIVSNHVASEVISSLIGGAQLDTIRIYSLVVQLGFVRLDAAEGWPNEIWVSVSGNLDVGGSFAADWDSKSAGDLFVRRAKALGSAYLLIGKRVTAVRVSESGALQMELEDSGLRADAGEDASLEEVWAVMSDTPDVSADHRWYVALDDSGVLSARAGPDSVGHSKFLGAE